MRDLAREELGPSKGTAPALRVGFAWRFGPGLLRLGCNLRRPVAAKTKHEYKSKREESSL